MSPHFSPAIVSSAAAQHSSIKLGANYNADFTDHVKSAKISYPSFEIAFEKPLWKKWSGSIGFNHAVRNVLGLDYATGGFIKSGLKVYYTLKGKADINHSQDN